MYINIGNDYLIKKQDVIGIFDLDNTTINKYTKEFLNLKEKQKKVIYIINNLPKSFILTADGTVYVVELLPQVLRKRFEIM